jgi:hypothetical protein
VKEDVLEQLVDDYFQAKDYFTTHNVKFTPRKDHPEFISLQDSNYSDIDVVGFKPRGKDPNRVWVCSCKSWQLGFNIKLILDDIKNKRTRYGREQWKQFRELTQPKWSEALIEKIFEITGTRKFTYFTAVTRVKGSVEGRALWENHKPFINAMGGNPIKLLSLSEMLDELFPKITGTVASSQLGRTLQLIKASGWEFAKTARKNVCGKTVV